MIYSITHPINVTHPINAPRLVLHTTLYDLSPKTSYQHNTIISTHPGEYNTHPYGLWYNTIISTHPGWHNITPYDT